MKTRLYTLHRIVLTGLLLFGTIGASAQDGIYHAHIPYGICLDDIYQPLRNATDTGNSSPLDGYSSHDRQALQESDAGGTYITNNYSNDTYDYFWASRINRFHRPIFGFGYYDPFYTNMYWYNYDPFFYGTSIYTSWGWGGFYNTWYRPWGYGICGMNYGSNPWGWGYHGYQPFCYGGPGLGYGLGQWNTYWNPYDQYSGHYYGHRDVSGGSIGNSYMSTPAIGTKPIPSRHAGADRINSSSPVHKPSPEPRRIETAPSDRTSPVTAPAHRTFQYDQRNVPRYEAPARTPQRPWPVYGPNNSNPLHHTPRPWQEPIRDYSTPRQNIPHRTIPLRSAPSPGKGIIPPPQQRGIPIKSNPSKRR